MVTDERICPFMSHPRQGDRITEFHGIKEPLFKSEDEMREYGYCVINGNPFSDIIPCLRERCIAWVPDCYLLKGIPSGHSEKEGHCPVFDPAELFREKVCGTMCRTQCTAYCRRLP
jgi:hypothetical protein